MKTPIIIFKGSFNPVHKNHIYIAELVEKIYGVKPIMMISANVYQKGWINSDKLLLRVEMLNDLGYSVLVNKDGYFNNNTAYIRQKFNRPIIYVVGSDTFNRILNSTYKILNNVSNTIRSIEINKFKADFENVFFVVVNRPNNKLEKDVKYVKDYYTVFAEHPDFYDISSTKIREMRVDGNYDGIRNMIPTKIYNKYINHI